MQATDSGTTAPTTEEIEAAYKYATGIAANQTRRQPQLREVALDAAADGIMWALANYQTEQGKTFGAFAAAAARTFIQRSIVRERHRFATAPDMIELGEWVEAPARTTGSAADIALPLEVQELPEELRNVVRLYYVDKFDFREIGHLLNCSMETARCRLAQAAKILGEGLPKPSRMTGARRLHR